MAGKRKVMLEGQEFGHWFVASYEGKSNYLCKCKLCGKERIISGYFLQNGTYPKCECQGDIRGKIDLTDRTFGKWTVLEYAGDKKWKCRCSCGVIRDVAGEDLRNGKSTECGHSTNRKFEDLTGRKFNEWKVIKYVKDEAKWECQCSCGQIRLVSAYQLKNGLSKSCGHSTTGFKDLTGMEFGEWSILGRAIDSYRLWTCICENCGTIRDIDGYALRSGSSKSCGCKRGQLQRETSIAKYGLIHPAQIGTDRTLDQLQAIESRDNLINFIGHKFKIKPTIPELSIALGLNRGTVWYKVHSWNMLSYVSTSNIGSSGYEKALQNIFPCQEIHNRTVLNGLEIDLLYREQGVGIEFNGTFWHSEIKKSKTYHQEKSLMALKNGIQLIHIFEYEWVDIIKRDKILRMLHERIDGKSTVINARNCSIVDEIDISEARSFLDENHLQGYTPASINIGLKYKSEFIGMMSFGKPRFTSACECELIRLCFKTGIIVNGGTEKLFKYFLDNYNVKSIVSYCDLSKFSGKVYTRLGFCNEGITTPGYRWVNIETNETLSRFQTMKDRLIERGLGDPSETEDEIMHRLGYVKVYDCGNFKFVWER